MTEVYMTQPAELPKTLPAGTRYMGNDGGFVACSSPVRLRNSYEYWGRWSDPSCDSWVDASRIDWTTVPRLSSPAPVEAPLVVGAEYEGLGSPESKVSDQWFRGKYLGPFIGLDGHSRLQESDNLVRVVQTASLKRIPDAGEGKAETKPCCRCGATVTRASDAADPGEMPTCRPCKAGVNKPAGTTDPYKKHRREELGPNERQWREEENARHRAALERHKAKHREDLDRGQAERLRNVRHWPAAVSTPSWEWP